MDKNFRLQIKNETHFWTHIMIKTQIKSNSGKCNEVTKSLREILRLGNILWKEEQFNYLDINTNKTYA